jgi:hypothetical protein
MSASTGKSAWWPFAAAMSVKEAKAAAWSTKYPFFTHESIHFDNVLGAGVDDFFELDELDGLLSILRGFPFDFFLHGGFLHVENTPPPK